MSYDTVAMIKQLPDKDVYCASLSFHGDVVYIGSFECIIQWNVGTDIVVSLKGYPRLILFRFYHTLFFTLLLGVVYGLDVSSDGSIVVGGSKKVVIAHSTATGAVLWRKEMPGKVWSLRIHGGVVVIPVDISNTVVLDATTGHQLHTLPSAGLNVLGMCVFDGLTSVLICCVSFFTV